MLSLSIASCGEQPQIGNVQTPKVEEQSVVKTTAKDGQVSESPCVEDEHRSTTLPDNDPQVAESSTVGVRQVADAEEASKDVMLGDEAQAAGYREWRTADGKKRIAKLIECSVDGTVELADRDRAPISLNVDQLQAEDQQLIKRCLNLADGRSIRRIRVEPVAQRPPKRWFLGIGVDNYNNELITDLTYCGRDVETLGKAFENLSYDVKILTVSRDVQRITDVTVKKDIEKALDKLLGVADSKGNMVIPGKAGPQDTVVLSFSGHGVFMSGEGYFCPADADFTQDAPEQTLVSVNQVYGQLAASPAVLKVMFVDACRNQLGGTRNVRGQGDKQMANLAQVLSQERKGIATFSSCSVGQKSLEDQRLQQGVFSHFLARGLEGAAATRMPGEVEEYQVGLLELCAYAAREAKKYAMEQRKHEQTPKLTASEIGNEPMGTLLELRVPPGWRFRVPTESYTLDLTNVKEGQLPNGWRAAGLVGVARETFAPTIESLAANGIQVVTSPGLEIKGDFVLEFEVIPRDAIANFDMVLIGVAGTANLETGFTSLFLGGGGWQIDLDKKPNAGGPLGPKNMGHTMIPCTFRFEREGGILSVYCDSDPSSKVILPGQAFKQYGKIEFRFHNQKCGISNLSLRPIRPVAKGNRGVFKTIVVKQQDFRTWNQPLPLKEQCLRLTSPPLAIREDFQLDTTFAPNDGNLYQLSLTLLAEDGGFDYPVWINGAAGFPVQAFMPGKGRCTTQEPLQLPIRLTIKRVGPQYTLMLNGKPVGEYRDTERAFRGIRLDGMNAENVSFSEIVVNPIGDAK